MDASEHFRALAWAVQACKEKLVIEYGRYTGDRGNAENTAKALGFASNWQRFRKAFDLRGKSEAKDQKAQIAAVRGLQDNCFLRADVRLPMSAEGVAWLRTHHPDLVTAFVGALNELERQINPIPVIPTVALGNANLTTFRRPRQFQPVDASLRILHRSSGAKPIPDWDDFLSKRVPDTQIDERVSLALEPCNSVTIVGRPSSGKTMLALRLAAKLVREGGDVVYLDLGDDPIRSDLKSEFDEHLWANRHIVIDNCHRDTRLADELRRRFGEIVSRKETVSTLLLLGTQTDAPSVETLAEPDQPFILERRHSSLSKIADFILRSENRFSGDDVDQWDIEFAGNLNAFALAVNQSRSSLDRGQSALSKFGAVDWHREHTLQPKGTALTTKERENLACLARFADQRLELAVSRGALPHPHTGLTNLVRSGTVITRDVARHSDKNKLALFEPGWGWMILAALGEPTEFELRTLVEDALREPLMALSLWRRFHARNEQDLARELAERVFEDHGLCDQIADGDPHYMMWWLHDVTQPYEDKRDSWRSRLLESHFRSMAAQQLANTAFDAITLRRLIRIVSRSENEDYCFALSSILVRNESTEWFGNRLADWEFGSAVALAKERDNFCTGQFIRWEERAFGALESDPNAMVEAILTSDAHSLGEVLVLSGQAKKRWGQDSSQFTAVNTAISGASHLFPSRFAKEPITVVGRALHEIDAQVRRDLFKEVPAAAMETAPERGKLNGAAWIIKACNEAGNQPAATKLAQVALASEDILAFASPNMMLFEIATAANISDIGQNGEEMAQTAQHVRAILTPDRLDQIFGDEGRDAVALADGLLPFATWRYPEAPELVFRPSLDRRIDGFFEQLSWPEVKLKTLAWYRNQAAKPKTQRIRNCNFRALQLVRLIGSYSLLFDVRDAAFRVTFPMSFDALARMDGVKHQANATSVQRHQMQSWFGLRAIASVSGRAIAVDGELLSETQRLWRANKEFSDARSRASAFRCQIMIDWLEKCLAAGAIIPDVQDIRWHLGQRNTYD